LISTLDESQIHVFMLEKSIEARNCSFLLSRRGNDKSPAQTWIHHFSRISSLFGRRSLPFLSDRAHIEEAEGIQRRQFTTVAARAANWFHRISRAHPVTRPTAPFVSFFPRLLHHFLLFLLSYSCRDETERNPARRPALPFACIAKRAVRSSITTVRTVLHRARRTEMIEGEDGERERKRQDSRMARDRERRRGLRMEENGVVEEPSS